MLIYKAEISNISSLLISQTWVAGQFVQSITLTSATWIGVELGINVSSEALAYVDSDGLSSNQLGSEHNKNQHR